MDGIEPALRCRHSVGLLLTDPPMGKPATIGRTSLPPHDFWDRVRWAVKRRGRVFCLPNAPMTRAGRVQSEMLPLRVVWYKERGTGFLNANRAR
jgi:site-specific DNA-methyltransferase (adenine-specific)